jgi:hypothetical protein
LEINHRKIFGPQKDSEEEIREAKCSLSFVKLTDLMSTEDGLRSLRQDWTSGKQKEIETENSWLTY